MPTDEEWARHLNTHEKIDDRLGMHGDRIAVLESQDRSILGRLAEGAKSMSADRERASKDAEKFSQKLDELGQRSEKAFADVHKLYGPKPWSIKRIITWALAGGLPVISIFIAAIWWAAQVPHNSDIDSKLGAFEKSMREEVVGTQKTIQTIEIRQAVQGESLGAIKASQERVDKQIGSLDEKIDLLIRALQSPPPK